VRFYNEIKSTPEGAGGLWLTQKERRKGEGCSSNIVANKLLSALSRLSNDELNVFFCVLKNVDARKCAKTGKLVASFSMPGLFGELKKAGAKSINESRMRKAFVNLSKGTAGIQFREEGADFVVCAFPTFKHDRSTHTITVQINDALKSCILNLKEHYTAIDFRNIASLNGKHAKLLYLELKRHSSKPTENYPYEGGGEWSFSIGQIKAVFGLGKFSYNNDTGRMKNCFHRSLFESRVLTPAILAINGSDMNPKGNADIEIVAEEWHRIQAIDSQGRPYSFKAWTVKWVPRANGTATAPKGELDPRFKPQYPRFCENAKTRDLMDDSEEEEIRKARRDGAMSGQINEIREEYRRYRRNMDR